jgi:N-acyl-D-aspartate/D-glutamate deacylase
MGRTYKDIIELSTMKPLNKERYEHLVENDRYASVLFNGASEDDMLKALGHPGVAVGSDAVSFRHKETKKRMEAWDTPYENLSGHPRSAGTHAKVLRLSREKKLMPLITAIKKMSYLQARFLEDNGVPQMAKKGRISEGADADITVFDPITVKDNSTRQNPALPSTGIPYVIVGGTVVVYNSEVVKDTYPGQPVRAGVSD